MASDSKPNDLFRIPRELRNVIYEIVLLFKNEAPESSNDSFQLECLPQPNVGGLLACNHQIRREVIDTITHHNMIEPGLHFELDFIGYAQSPQLTWLWVPAPMKYIKQMTVTYRIPLNTNLYLNCSIAMERALEHWTDRTLRLFTQFFDPGPYFTLGDHRPQTVGSCRSLYHKRLCLNVALTHYESGLRRARLAWHNSCTAEDLKANKERFNTELCRAISLYVGEDELLGLDDRLIVQSDPMVMAWQLRNKK